MSGKQCEIMCEGKKVATISYGKDKVEIKCTDEGRKFCSQFAGCC